MVFLPFFLWFLNSEFFPLYREYSIKSVSETKLYFSWLKKRKSYFFRVRFRQTPKCKSLEFSGSYPSGSITQATGSIWLLAISHSKCKRAVPWAEAWLPSGLEASYLCQEHLLDYCYKVYLSPAFECLFSAYLNISTMLFQMYLSK